MASNQPFLDRLNEDGSKEYIKAIFMLYDCVDGLRYYTEKKVILLHNRLKHKLGSEICERKCKPRIEPEETCKVCWKWRETLKQLHTNPANIYWSNVDPKLFPKDPCEVAKIFMSKGKQAGKEITIKTLDISGVLNLMINCREFKDTTGRAALRMLNLRNELISHAYSPKATKEKTKLCLAVTQSVLEKHIKEFEKRISAQDDEDQCDADIIDDDIALEDVKMALKHAQNALKNTREVSKTRIILDDPRYTQRVAIQNRLTAIKEKFNNLDDSVNEDLKALVLLLDGNDFGISTNYNDIFDIIVLLFGQEILQESTLEMEKLVDIMKAFNCSINTDITLLRDMIVYIEGLHEQIHQFHDEMRTGMHILNKDMKDLKMGMARLLEQNQDVESSADDTILEEDKRLIPYNQNVSVYMTNDILLVHTRDDKSTAVVQDFKQCFMTSKIVPRSIHETCVIGNKYERFQAAAKNSLLVVFILTPEFFKNNDCTKYFTISVASKKPLILIRYKGCKEMVAGMEDLPDIQYPDKEYFYPQIEASVQTEIRKQRLPPLPPQRFQIEEQYELAQEDMHRTLLHLAPCNAGKCEVIACRNEVFIACTNCASYLCEEHVDSTCDEHTNYDSSSNMQCSSKQSESQHRSGHGESEFERTPAASRSKATIVGIPDTLTSTDEKIVLNCPKPSNFYEPASIRFTYRNTNAIANQKDVFLGEFPVSSDKHHVGPFPIGTNKVTVIGTDTHVFAFATCSFIYERTENNGAAKANDDEEDKNDEDDQNDKRQLDVDILQQRSADNVSSNKPWSGTRKQAEGFHNEKGNTPLHKAAKSRSEGFCKMLLNNAAPVNAVNNQGNTPLHEAAKSGSEGCCRILLDHRAIVDAVNNSGNTPLHAAAESGSEGCCRILLDYKATVNAVDNRGNTPLHAAAESGSEACCRILLNHKAPVNAVNNSHETPLHKAVNSGSEGCCRILLDHGSPVNAVDKDGYTPLHTACTRYNGGLENVTVLLIRAGADISLKNKVGDTPLDHLSFFRRRRLQQEWDKFTLHRKLMEQGSRPVDVVKVFLCGDASAGKTTIKKTLTKKLSVLSMIKRLFSNAKKEEYEIGNYAKTPGIDVHKQSVKGVGQFLFWDCAGHTEYAITHGMFLGTAHAVFLVVYDIQKISMGEIPSTQYWLPFIKATRAQQDKPKVILVGSHLDKIQDQRNASRAAQHLLQRCQEMFHETLDIDDALILLDAREENSEGMELLKNVLSKRRKQIIGTERLPRLCDKMQNIIKPWREEDVPVISWKEYLQRVKERYTGMDEDTLKSVTSYLHMMGEVYLAEFAEKEDQVILDTQWFTSEIIGSAFAGKEFSYQFQTLLDRPYYTQQELREFFTPNMDISQLLALLNHMDLVHETADEKFLLPGKLPNVGLEVDWDTSKAYDVKGRSIECAKEIDIFNPNVFPCVQKQILDECRSRGSTTDVSRSTVKFAIGSIEVFVKLTKHKRSINVAAMCPDKDSREDCYKNLLHVVELIQVALLEKSPGTELRESYISHDCLRATKNLEDVTTYTKEDLMKAEEKDGIVDNQVQPEEVTNILFQGYDKMFLHEFGSECRYEWMPIETVARCFGRLDRVNEWKEDYRAVGETLGIPRHVVDQLAEDSRTQKESTTANIIKKWCIENKRRMTIGMLKKNLGRLSLVANEDALNAIDELEKLYKIKYRHDDKDDNAFEISVSETLSRWRLVIKRQWSVLKADMDPNMLTSRLPYLPLDVCVVFEGTKSTDVQQRIKNAETLLLFLLDREVEDWPQDLICGFRETDQRPLAQTLEEEFEKVGREAAAREEKRTHEHAFAIKVQGSKCLPVNTTTPGDLPLHQYDQSS